MRKGILDYLSVKKVARKGKYGVLMGILAAFLMANIGYSATLTYDNTLTNGTTADADEVMENFTNVKTFVEAFDGANINSGTVTNTQISGSAQIDSTKIEGGTTDVNLQTFNSSYRAGVQCVYEAVGNITVTTGEIMINGKLRRNTSATDSAWTAASTTASGLDTGSEAASTWYYVYACADNSNATTFTIATSTSSSAPSYSGATNYRLIGRFYNDGSSNINSVINTGGDHQGLKIASGKVIATGTSMTVNIGFQPIFVTVYEGDASIAGGEAVVVLKSTQDMDVDNFQVREISATSDWQADTNTPGVQSYTTTGFTINTTNTYTYHFVAFGY